MTERPARINNECVSVLRLSSCDSKNVGIRYVGSFLSRIRMNVLCKWSDPEILCVLCLRIIQRHSSVSHFVISLIKVRGYR